MIHVFTLIFLKESNSKCHIALTSTLDPIMDPQVFFKMNINILFIILKTHLMHVLILFFFKESKSKFLKALTNTFDHIMDPQVYFKMYIMVEYINILFIILKTHVIHVLIFFKESECKCLIALTNNSDPIMDPQVYFKMYIMVKYTWWSIRGSRVFMRAMRHLLLDSIHISHAFSK